MLKPGLSPWNRGAYRWIRDANGHGVCQMPAMRTYGLPMSDEDSDRNQANEALILAAPIMLAALESLVSAIGPGAQDARHIEACWRNARATIQQAKGE